MVNVLNILNIFSNRNKQLQEEVYIDKIIKNTSKECPDNVIKFLLFYRKMNRESASIMQDKPIYEWFTIAKSSMDTIDDIQDKIKKSKNICKTLTDLCYIEESNNDKQ